MHFQQQMKHFPLSYSSTAFLISALLNSFRNIFQVFSKMQNSKYLHIKCRSVSQKTKPKKLHNHWSKDGLPAFSHCLACSKQRSTIHVCKLWYRGPWWLLLLCCVYVVSEWWEKNDFPTETEMKLVKCVLLMLLCVVSRRMQNVGEQGHMALLGHSLAAYISVLEREQLRKLTTRILSDTTLWLCRLFR